MFGLSFPELLIVLVVALIVLGPERLPKVARTIGKGMREIRKATGDFKDVVESEFYKLDEQVKLKAELPGSDATPAAGAPVAGTTPQPVPGAIPASTPHSVAMAPPAAGQAPGSAPGAIPASTPHSVAIAPPAAEQAPVSDPARPAGGGEDEAEAPREPAAK